MAAPHVRTRVDAWFERVFLVFVVVVAAAVLLTLVGCAAQPERIVVREPVEVKVPVPVKAQPPEELLEPVAAEPLPQFIAACDEHASSALDAEGERRIKHLLLRLQTRIEQWETWATTRDQEH